MMRHRKDKKPGHEKRNRKTNKAEFLLLALTADLKKSVLQRSPGCCEKRSFVKSEDLIIIKNVLSKLRSCFSPLNGTDFDHSH